MEPWAAVVSAAAVGFVSGLLVLSAGTIGRLLPRLFPPSPKASQLTASHRGEERITIASRTRDASCFTDEEARGTPQPSEPSDRRRPLSAVSPDRVVARHPGEVAGCAIRTAAAKTANAPSTFTWASTARWSAATLAHVLCVERPRVDDLEVDRRMSHAATFEAIAARFR